MDQADSCIAEPQIELTTAVDNNSTSPNFTPMARAPFNAVKPAFSDMVMVGVFSEVIGCQSIKKLQITRGGFTLMILGQSR